VAIATPKTELDVNHACRSSHAMTSEQAIALIGAAVDYSRQRCKLLQTNDRRVDADAINREFEEWLNPKGDDLPLMPCPLPNDK